MPWVTHRWLGGTLTNWSTIQQRVNELKRLERMRDRGEFEILTKREALGQERKIARLDMLFGGIRDLNGLPDVLFVVDVNREETAVHEANILEIPVVAMVDTNCNPQNIGYVIPSNDDAIRAIKLIVGKIADAVLEGQAMQKEEAEEYPPAAEVSYEETAEMTDEELLGEATLAKLEAQKVEEEEKEAEKEEAAEEEEEDEEPIDAEEIESNEVDEEEEQGEDESSEDEQESSEDEE